VPKHSDTTNGGVVIRGSVTTGGGDIVGRDKVQYISPTQLDEAFCAIARAIEVADPERKQLAEQKLQSLKDEVEKGKRADDSVVAKLVEGLVALVPSALSSVVGIFANPILGGIAGPITKYVLDKIQSKEPRPNSTGV
jgi:hypothetical protein